MPHQRADCKPQYGADDDNDGIGTVIFMMGIRQSAKTADDCVQCPQYDLADPDHIDRKSTRLNSSHVAISYAVFCLKKKKKKLQQQQEKASLRSDAGTGWCLLGLWNRRGMSP